jgi:hypothetical protein
MSFLILGLIISVDSLHVRPSVCSQNELSIYWGIELERTSVR